MRRTIFSMLLAFLAATVLAPATAHGQLFRKMKELAARRVAEAAAEHVTTANDAGAHAVDSTVHQGARRLDTAGARAGEQMRSAIKAAGPVDDQSRAAADSATTVRLSAELSAGRSSLEAIRFVDGDRLDAASDASLRLVARALHNTTGGYLVSVRISAPLHAQRMADGKAAAIRAALVSSGVDAGRLFSAGYGSKGSARSERVELLRIK